MAIKGTSPNEDLGRVVSRLSTPVTFTYKGEKVRLSGRGQTNADVIRGELGELPNGVVFVPN